MDYSRTIKAAAVQISPVLYSREGTTEKVLDAIADLDFSLITKRKRMMDSVGHYSRPDLLQLKVNQESYTVWHNSQNNPEPSTGDRQSTDLSDRTIKNDFSPTLPLIDRWTNEN